MWAIPVSYAIFYTIKVTVGLRVSEEEELEGLDIHEHGMHAYPPSMVADGATGTAPIGVPAPVPSMSPSASPEGA